MVWVNSSCAPRGNSRGSRLATVFSGLSTHPIGAEVVLTIFADYCAITDIACGRKCYRQTVVSTQASCDI